MNPALHASTVGRDWSSAIARDDLFRFLAETGHTPRIMPLGAKAPSDDAA